MSYATDRYPGQAGSQAEIKSAGIALFFLDNWISVYKTKLKVIFDFVPMVFTLLSFTNVSYKVIISTDFSSTSYM